MRTLVLAGALAFGLGAGGAFGQQGAAADSEDAWPQWRGPMRDGRAPAFKAPEHWPKVLDLRWKVGAGEGHASPVVADGKLFLLHRRGDDEVVSAFALHSGKELWSHSYAALFPKNSYATAHPAGPFATPAADGGRLFTLGVGAVLSAWDTGTGELLWRHTPEQPLDSSKLFTGTSASPLVTDSNVIVHLGDDRGGRLAAFDAATGKERWSWKGAGPGYASPVETVLAGRRQVVSFTTGAAVGISLDDGSLLWTYPFEDEWNENIVTPVPMGDRLLLGGVRQGLLIVEIVPAPEGAEGPPFVPQVVWHRKDLTVYMSTPVVDDGMIFGFSNKEKGHFFGVGAETGKTRWTSEGRQGENALLIDAGRLLLALTTEARLLVIPKSRETFHALHTYEVGTSATWAHPALVDRTVFLKETVSLAAWQIDDGLPPPKPMAQPAPRADAEERKNPGR